jgi:hypothetical protein
METKTEQPVAKPNKFLIPAEDADCLQDMDVYRFYEPNTERKNLIVPTKRAMVETYYLSSKYREQAIIKVTPVRVMIHNKVIDVMADVVTGTLYHKTGECLSSDRRRVIKWEK